QGRGHGKEPFIGNRGKQPPVAFVVNLGPCSFDWVLASRVLLLLRLRTRMQIHQRQPGRAKDRQNKARLHKYSFLGDHPMLADTFAVGAITTGSGWCLPSKLAAANTPAA